MSLFTTLDHDPYLDTLRAMVLASSVDAMFQSERQNIQVARTVEDYFECYNRIRVYIIQSNAQAEALNCEQYWKDQVIKTVPAELTDSQKEAMRQKYDEHQSQQ